MTFKRLGSETHTELGKPDRNREREVALNRVSVFFWLVDIRCTYAFENPR